MCVCVFGGREGGGGGGLLHGCARMIKSSPSAYKLDSLIEQHLLNAQLCCTALHAPVASEPTPHHSRTVLTCVQVAPSIGATYFLYSLLTQQWGIGGIRRYPHGNAPGASKPPLSATSSS